MSDSENRFSNVPPTDSLEEDAIIDLVDEIEEGTSAATISALEKQLLGIPGEAGRQPGVPDLSGIRFDEDDEAQPVAPTTAGAARAGGGASEIEEITEFEEQYLDPEELLDPKPASRAAAKDEPPEMLDLDEAELDNELLLFDDLTKDDAPSDAKLADETEHEEIELLLPEDADLGPTSAADVFAAHLDSMFAETGAPPDPSEGGIVVPLAAEEAAPIATPATVPAAAFIAAAAAATAPAAGGVVPAESPQPGRSESARIAPEEIEAAVERVIERKLGGTIEAAILRAIETAVTREIERLKQLLTEDETA